MPEATDTALFSLAILGTVLFSYYQGRSVDSSLLAVCWPAVIICGIFVSRLCGAVPQKTLLFHPSTHKLWKGFCLAFLLVFSLGTFLSSAIAVQMTGSRTMVDADFRKNVGAIEQVMIEEHGENNFDVYLIGESLYYDYFNLSDTKPTVNAADIWYITDCDDIFEFLLRSRKPVVVSNEVMKQLAEFAAEDALQQLEQNHSLETHGELVFLFAK